MILGNSEQKKSLLRLMFYGKAKSKKTWFALKAAELGYNVILCDGDDGHHIMSQLPMDARARMAILPLIDHVNSEGNNVSAFHDFMARLVRGNSFAYRVNSETSNLEKVGATMASQFSISPDNYHIVVHPREFTPNDVLIIDSWTALMRSLEMYFGVQNKKDYMDASKQEWDDYSWAKRTINKILHMLHALPCHVIIIGHTQYYEKYEGRGKDRQLVEQNMQPMSYSGPQGKLLAKEFSDIMYFYQDKLDKFRISSKASHGREGGCRILPPKEYMWDDIDFSTFVAESNGIIKPPTEIPTTFNSKGLEILEPGILPRRFNKPIDSSKSPKAISPLFGNSAE
jgi:predicted GNAT family acetyltransferase